MKLATVAPTAVTLDATPVAVDGIEQLPLVPATANEVVSPAPSGVARVPTLVPPALVSTSLHAPNLISSLLPSS